MKYLMSVCAAFALLALAPVWAEEDHVQMPDTGLITSLSPAPETAANVRADGILRDETGRPVTHPLLGQPLFQFEAPLLGGGKFSSDDLRGRWTVMVFWGVWCHDSRNDAENIAAVSGHFAQMPDIGFMSLHVPFNREHLNKRFGDHGSVEAYFEAAGYSWPTALDEEGILRNWQKIQWTPTYLVIGPDMTVEAYRTDLSISGEGALERFITEVEALAGKG